MSNFYGFYGKWEKIFICPPLHAWAVAWPLLLMHVAVGKNMMTDHPRNNTHACAGDYLLSDKQHCWDNDNWQMEIYL